MRRLVLIALTLAALGAGTAEAAADANTTVSGSTNSDGGSVTVSHPGSSSGSGGSSGSAGNGPPIACRYYEIATGEGSTSAVSTVGAEASSLVEGTQYWKQCTNTATGAVTSLQLITGPAAVDPAQLARDLAQEASARLVLPPPSAASNPPNGEAIVNVPVWLWVGDWQPRSESASAAGVTATVTAAPTHVRWDTGDGHVTTCRGPGTPYDTARPPAAQSTTCSHTYTGTTGRLRVTAAQSWHLTYVATNGQSGDLGVVTRTSTMPIDVRELVTNIRPG